MNFWSRCMLWLLKARSTEVIKNVLLITGILVIGSCMIILLFNDSNTIKKLIIPASSSVVYFQTITSKNSSPHRVKSERKWKLLVPGSTWFNENKDWNEYLANCEQKCIYSPDPRLIPLADAVLFHYNLPWETIYYNSSIHHRLPHQQFISFSQESPLSLNSKFGSSYEDPHVNFYNWTMSYRKNNRIYYPYGKIISEHYGAIDPERLRNITMRKKKTAIWIASHCKTFSRREEIVQKLLHHINLKIDIWGDCGKKEICPRKEESICEQKIENDYFFFFAFENSICSEYVTEKLWDRANKFFSIPVVLNRKIAEDVGFPGDGLIAVDDFPNISDLGDFLFKLQRNLTEYERYFEWKSRYRIVDGDDFGWCNLCSHLWDDTAPIAALNDAARIFQNVSECQMPN